MAPWFFLFSIFQAAARAQPTCSACTAARYAGPHRGVWNEEALLATKRNHSLRVDRRRADVLKNYNYTPVLMFHYRVLSGLQAGLRPKPLQTVHKRLQSVASEETRPERSGQIGLYLLPYIGSTLSKEYNQRTAETLNCFRVLPCSHFLPAEPERRPSARWTGGVAAGVAWL